MDKSIDIDLSQIEVSNNNEGFNNFNEPMQFGEFDEECFLMQTSLNQEIWCKFLTLLIKKGIVDHPRNANLKILMASIQATKLKNYYNAIFELFNAEQCEKSLQNRLTIFRMKIDIEHSLRVLCEKNSQDRGNLDTMLVYQYQKLFQQYAMIEYLTAQITIKFWKELQQKQMSPETITERGQIISKNYERIQRVTFELFKISPDDIKILCRYGCFLKQIANNDFEAQQHFEKAYIQYQMKISRKFRRIDDGTVSTEQGVFGENSAAALIMISASTSQRLGTIIHANEEVQNLLGYTPRELIGMNVSMLMPRPFAELHDQFLVEYLKNGQPRIMNQRIQRFGETQLGYIRNINLLVKFYPQITDKLLFLGFIAPSQIYSDFEDPPIEFKNKEHHFIMTDMHGDITNVTDGLNRELGLHHNFFKGKSFTQNLINFKMICPDILESNIEDVLLGGGSGQILTFDTRELLTFVDLEALSSSDEILEIRAKLGIFEANIQLKRYYFDYLSNKFINTYRIILISNSEMTNSMQIQSSIKKSEEMTQMTSQTLHSSKQMFKGTKSSVESRLDISSANTSSSSSNYFMTGFGKTLRDFKSALNSRQTPRNLVVLNLVIAAIILAFIALSTIALSYEQNLTALLNEDTHHMFEISSRNVEYVLLASNIRSLINIANNYEPNYYEGLDLKDINRFYYLSTLIQTQAESLQDIQSYLNSYRVDPDAKDFDSSAIYSSDLILVHRLDGFNQFYTQNQPYRVAMQIYLNIIQVLNHTTINSQDLLLDHQFLIGTPSNEFNFLEEKNIIEAIENNSTNTTTISNATKPKFVFKIPAKETTVVVPPILNNQSQNYTQQTEPKLINSTTDMQQNMIFLLLNGLRSLREMTLELTEFHVQSSFSYTMDEIFLGFMITAIILSSLLIMAITSELWQIERNKAAILSLFTLLTPEEIIDVNQKCQLYLENLEFESSIRKEVLTPLIIDFDQQLEILPIDDGKRNQNVDTIVLTEESKDDEKTKNRRRLIIQNVLLRKKQKHTQEATGAEIYSQMIKKAIDMIKEIQEQKVDNSQQHIQNPKGQSDLSFDINDEKLSAKRLIQDQNEEKKKAKQKNILSKMNLKMKEVEIVNVDSDEETKSYDSQNKDEKSQKQIKPKKPRLPRKTKIGKEVAQVNRQHQYNSMISSRWRFMGISSIFSMIFAAYFVYCYIFHVEQMSSLRNVKSGTAVLLDRYSDMILAYDFLREKILNNNTLDSYIIPGKKYSPINIDEFFKERSFLNEMLVKHIKMLKSESFQKISDFAETLDSERFCTEIIGSHSSYDSTSTLQIKKLSQKQLQDIRLSAYQKEIQSVIAACNAANDGNIEELKQLRIRKIDFNVGDYDQTTPLHIACGAGQMEVVKYLVLEVGVDVNPKDRWGVTPYGNANKYPEIKQLLLSNGASFVTSLKHMDQLHSSVNEDQYRLYYAAYYGNVQMMDSLRQLSWNVNGQNYDRRTALGIAASEGHLEAVKYLVTKGANVSLTDFRGNDALDDAKRENRTQVVLYLEEIINQAMIRDSCETFQDGVLAKGIQQAFGIFHKRMADLIIAVDQTNAYKELINFLNNTQYADTTNNSTTTSSSGVHKTLHMFFQVKELYLPRLIIQMSDMFRVTLITFITSYDNVTFDLFMAFLVYQLVSLLYIRRWLVSLMKQEVFQSRGILNLIPERFFQLNKEHAEKIIKRLKA